MINIFQEAMLMGIDGADLFRQVRLVVDETNPDTLILDPEYEKLVERSFLKYLEDVQALQEKQSKIVIG